jgi:molybdopterin molybdotransferase
VKLLHVDTVAAAREKLAACTADWSLPVEWVDAAAASGRVLAQDSTAAADVPGFRRSTVDGYAVVSADTAGAGEAIPVMLRLAGSVEMGRPAGFAIQRGECAYVPTGGMIPGGADAMVMVEYAETAGTAAVAVYEPAAVGRGIAGADEDVRRGETVLARGTCLRPPEIGVLAALGIGRVPVYGSLRLALFSTGDEIAAAGNKPAPGQIYDINAPALSALAARRGFDVVMRQTIPDDAALLEPAIRSAMDAADVVVVSGGSSQGEKDLTAGVFERIAESGTADTPVVFTHGIAIKPGKPTILGFDRVTRTILCGLPGHPVSAMLVFEALLSPLYRALSGQRDPFPVPAELSRDLAAAPGKAVYQPVILRRGGGAYLAEPVFGKSGMISTLSRADGYIIIEINKEGVRRGETVWVHLL